MQLSDYFSSEKVRKFIMYATRGTDAPLRLATEDGIPIVILEANGTLHVLIEITEGLTQDQIREALPWIFQWRELLANYQEIPLLDDSEFIHGALIRCKDHLGLSYAALAEIINALINNKIQEFVKYKEECTQKGIAPFDHLNVKLVINGEYKPERRRFKNDSKSYGDAFLILESMRLSAKAVKNMLAKEISAAEAGNELFLENYPISKAKMRSVLRPYMSGNKKNPIRDIHYGSCGRETTEEPIPTLCFPKTSPLLCIIPYICNAFLYYSPKQEKGNSC